MLNMAASSHSRMKSNFTIGKSKKDLCNRWKAKIEELFDVEIEFDLDNGKFETQWVSVSGTNCDCQNAKDYISGLCSPDETVKIKCLFEDEMMKNDILLGMEKNTRAVIEVANDNYINISGSVLSVTLAVSSLEEVLGKSCVVETDEAQPDSNGKNRLDDVLREALSHIEDEDCNIDDYSSLSNNVKRAMIDSMVLDTTLDEIRDSDLFADDKERTKTSFAKGMVKQSAAQTSSAEASSFDISNSRRKETSANNYDDLFQIATLSGYTKEEVAEGMLYVQAFTKPSDFLSMLHDIRESKIRLGLIPANCGVTPKREAMNSHISILDDDSDGHISVSDSTVIEAESSESDDNDVIFVEELKAASKPRCLETELTGRSKIKCPDATDEQKKLKELYEQQVSTPARGKVDTEQTYAMAAWKTSEPPWKTEDTKSDFTHANKKTRETHTTQEKVKKRPNASVIEKQDKDASTKPKQKVAETENAPLVDTENQQKFKEPRYVVVDGSNVARAHGNNGKVFSCIGIKLCVDYFLKLGHKKITVFVPGWRQKRSTAAYPIENQEILEQLKSDGYLAFTPHRQLPSGVKVASYDDRFILELADKEDGVIVSNDQYRDFFNDKASYRKLLEERCVPFVFVGDNFMLPQDPYGINGPTLEEVLYKNINRQTQRPQPVPSVPKTFNQPPPAARNFRCDPLNSQQYPAYQPGYYRPQQYPYPYYHQYNHQQMPYGTNWRNDKPGTLSEQFLKQDEKNQNSRIQPHSPPVLNQDAIDGRMPKSLRSSKETNELIAKLKTIFSEKQQEEKIFSVLNNHPKETDINILSNYCLNCMTTQDNSIKPSV